MTYFLVLLVFLISNFFVEGFNLTFDPSNPEVFVDHQVEVEVTFHASQQEISKILNPNATWIAESEPDDVLSAEFNQSSIECYGQLQQCNASLVVHGKFLGFGKVSISLQEPDTKKREKFQQSLKVTVLRQDTIWNTLFVVFVAVVVSINYINMGCALDLDVVKTVLKKPIGPAVGFVCQFIVMPLVSYLVGYLIFEDPVLRLGLFTFGSSPGGGASNMWTVLLGGNLNLSITMTFVSSIAALGTIPLWLFSLGRTILKGTNIVIPFQNILTSLVALAIPIGLGVLIQKKFPKIAARSKKILAPVSIILLISIIILASVANSYIFFLLTWRMVIGASLSVWTGFAVGVLMSLVFRFPSEDVIAIAVETGIQNSGIAFLLLSYSLKAPVSDMASVVPVAGSIITPIPLFIIYCYQKFRKCCRKSDDPELEAISKKSEKSENDFENKGYDGIT